MQYVIGCDIGSQSLRAVLISAEGKICGEASASYPIEYPQPTWAQQSPASWMDALAQSVRSLLAHSDVTPRQIIALGLDAQVDGVVALDRSGQPLYPAIIWMDRRAVSEFEVVGRKISQKTIFGITGLKLCDFVRAGLPYIATHPHFNCPTETGFMPDIGAMIVFVHASTGREPDLVVGKPNRMIIDAIAHKLGLNIAEMAMVGDRLYTNIAVGKLLASQPVSFSAAKHMRRI